MAKLVLSSHGTILSQCFVDQERLTIGREPHNQVVIDDRSVSREHAAITPVGNDHILEDLGSANGTFVNGTRVPRRILQHGDVIEFGIYHLRYLNPRAASAMDLDRTMLIAGLAGATHDDTAPVSAHDVHLPAARVTRTRFPSGRVRMVGGNDSGATIELDRVIATFGRPGRRVAVITRRPHGYFLSHVEGWRKLRVNGRPIGRSPHALANGDVIEVDDRKLEFILDQARP
jgi:pSer/pThr/pTyr-binding forkhead associated (FHA) protein